MRFRIASAECSSDLRCEYGLKGTSTTAVGSVAGKAKAADGKYTLHFRKLPTNPESVSQYFACIRAMLPEGD